MKTFCQFVLITFLSIFINAISLTPAQAGFRAMAGSPIAIQTPAYAYVIPVPSAPENCGTLLMTHISVGVTSHGILEFESLSPNPGTGHIENAVPYYVRANGIDIFTGSVGKGMDVAVEGYDGTLDFQGASGVTLPYTDSKFHWWTLLPPGTVAVEFIADNGMCTGHGPGNVESACTQQVGAQITYNFTCGD